MNAALVVIVLAGLVVFATILGLLYRATRGRVRRATNEETMAIEGLSLTEAVTLVQFSTEVCAPCVSTARVLSEVARTSTSTSHVEIDLTSRPELASRYNIMQTPTTFVLDRTGVVRARIGGAVRRDVVVAEVDRVLRAASTYS